MNILCSASDHDHVLATRREFGHPSIGKVAMGKGGKVAPLPTVKGELMKLKAKMSSLYA